MKTLDARDTALLMALAADERGIWAKNIASQLSKNAKPVAVALRKGTSGRSEAARRAAAILDSVRANREAAKRRAKISPTQH